MKKREEISEKYKWDISAYSKSNEDCISELEIVQKEMQKIKKYEGKLNNEKSIFECLKLNSEISLILNRLYSYSFFKVSEDGNNSESKALNEKVTSVIYEYESISAFITVEISELSIEFLTNLMNNSEFPEFSNYFKDIIRTRKHILSKTEEKLLIEMNKISETFSLIHDMLTDVDFVFEPAVDSKGKKHELTYGNFSNYIESPDRTLRKNSAINIHKPFEKFNNTLASNYIGAVKSDCIKTKLRKFESSLDSSLFWGEISRTVYDNLIDSVHKNLGIFYKYFEAKRLKLKLKKMATYDLSVPINHKLNTKISYDDAIQLIKKVVLPMGEEYVNLIQQAYDERWIDVYENKGKQSGGYQSESYGLHPVILMNFKDNFRSVFTLIHELGHAMHSHYTNKTQPPEKAGYSIFLAEIASTVNEILMLLYLINNSNSTDERVFYYDKFFHSFYGSVNRQTMLAEFEDIIHKTYEQTQVLSKDLLNNTYLELNRKYLGENIELLPTSKFSWSTIPHFYSSFYVYKYATGFISALHIAKRLYNKEASAKENYLKFLSSGSSLPPLETLKIAGVNLEDPRTFQEVFDFASTILKNWK